MMFYSNIFGSLRRLIAAFALVSAAFVSVSAHAGSIVINQADPNGSLQYKDDTGRTKDLLVSWSDLQLIAKVKGYLLSKHGEPGRSMPYMIDRSTQTVNVLVDRSAGLYESVSFAQFKGF